MCSIERKLKTFIENKRLKKRQEIETSINRQRQKCEEEIRRNRMKMSLDEVWQELSKLEKRLLDLKQTKHQLFSQLKKVLNEDEQRRRHRETLWHSPTDPLPARPATPLPVPTRTTATPVSADVHQSDHPNESDVIVAIVTGFSFSVSKSKSKFNSFSDK